MKVAFTGGHLTPALGFLDYILAKKHQAIFIGREFSQKNTQQPSQERPEVEKRKVKFLHINCAQINQQSLTDQLWNLITIASGTIQAIKILHQEKIDVVMSFGSYVAFPTTLAAYVLRIPIILHEQTTTPGLSSKIIAKIAKYVAVSSKDSAVFFGKKSVITGNILRPEILKINHQSPDWITKPLTHPLLLIMGGNQGSAFINNLISENLEDLLQNWSIIHQCGNDSKEISWVKNLEQKKSQLPEELRDRYYLKTWIDQKDLSWIYTHVKIIISRSGANSVAEILSRKIPSIFIPLAHAHDQEQLKNAIILQEAKVSIILEQHDIDNKKLFEAINFIINNYTQMKTNFQKIENPHLNAEEKLYHLFQLVTKKESESCQSDVTKNQNQQ